MSEMKYRFLGNSGLKVSEICLGTLTFGQVPNAPSSCTEEQSHAILDRFVELGGNFIDTANVYKGGQTEKIIGSWLIKQQRESLVIATKVRGGSRKHVNAVGLSRHHIMQAVNESLERLQTSYIDLYQTHFWDNAVPVEETLCALNDLVRQGKVRYIGVSNLTGWQLQKMILLCKYNNWAPIVSYQPQWNLLSRQVEFEMVDLCRAEGIGVIPWSPLKGGWLTGKMKREVPPPEGSRVSWVDQKDDRETPSHPSYGTFNKDSVWTLLDEMDKIGKIHKHSVAQVALKWLLQKDIISSVIMGAKTVEQLEDNMGATGDWSLTEEQMDHLDNLTAPEVPYPYEMVFRLNKDRIRKYNCQ